MSNLLTFDNAKTPKGEKEGFLTGILYLKPADSSGLGNLCPKASAGCKAACLNTAGLGVMSTVQQGRQRKTELFFNDPNKFVESLVKEVKLLEKRAEKKGMTPCVRINGTSDMPSLARAVAKQVPDVQFYDYTKLPKPYKRTLPNYHLTFSRSEDNMDDCLDAIEHGINVAVVFKDVPKTYLGRPVISGDETDLRFLDGRSKDGKGLIIGLTAKGKAKKDTSGFVVQ
jgi:hypothetical protein